MTRINTNTWRPNPTSKPDQPVYTISPSDFDNDISLVFPRKSSFVGADGEFQSLAPTQKIQVNRARGTGSTWSPQGNDGLGIIGSASENQIPPYVETPAED